MVLTPPYDQQPAAKGPISNQTLLPEEKLTELHPSQASDVMDHLVMGPTEVKEEVGREHVAEEVCVETQLEAESCKQEGEDLDISFDSQFPDLISDFITEEPNAMTAESPAQLAAQAPASVFTTGVRYMVPPQPLPSSSFLPFPQPLPSSSASRLASITDFSPEWSYPEVTSQQQKTSNIVIGVT